MISAIGIIRVSGDGAINAADKIFRAACGKGLAEAENRRMYYGELTDADGRLIDLCLCCVSRGPDSYTGEDTVEFHCHGSPVVLSEGLHALFTHGVRQAEAGEFTKRAFLGGRMDLAQAEAVIDLIEAETPAVAQNAAYQLRGVMSEKLTAVYSSLLDIMAHFHAVIDYPDEKIDEFEMQSYLPLLSTSEEELSRMLATHARGRLLHDGVPTAIVGRPNTGKSSLLNALLGYDRAIVTDISGTTRDVISEKILIGGLLLRLIDTAGLRKTEDTIEKLGVERTMAALNSALLVIHVLDGSEPLRAGDFDVIKFIPRDARKLTVLNKSDLPSVVSTPELSVFGIDHCRVSALTGEGLDVLESKIKELFAELKAPPAGELLTNVRHAEAIARARDSITLAIAAVTASVTPDAVLTEVESALSAIGEVTGLTMREDITTRIFERFCVGK